MGVGALQSNNRFWLRSDRNQSDKNVNLQFSAAPPLHTAVVARLDAAPARRSVPHSFTRHFKSSPSSPNRKTINSSDEASARASARADGGGRLFSKKRFSRCAREFK
jgi:hypothetical protein